jgi:hypothetical protein
LDGKAYAADGTVIDRSLQYVMVENRGDTFSIIAICDTIEYSITAKW